MDPLTKGQDSLELFDFGALLQALSSNLKVGVLAVRSGEREKFLHLDGATLHCVYTRKPRVTLQKVLYNHRAVELGPLRIAAGELGPDRTDLELARWLLEREIVTPGQIARARRYQVVEEVLALFYWPNVGFEFYAEDGTWSQRVSAERLQPVGDPTSVDDVLVQCQKTIDDIAKFNSVMPSLRDVYDLQFGSLQELEQAVPDPAERELVLLIDGVRDMREVLGDMRMNRFDALELFYRYRTSDRIRPKNSFELLMLAENRRADFSLDKRMRVLERVNELGVEGFGVVLPLAETYEELGKPKKAAACFARHARLAADAGQSEAALGSVTKAIDLAPDDPEHRRLRVELLLTFGERNAAAVAYRKLGDTLRERGDVAGALDALRQSVELDGGDPDGLRSLGETLALSGDALRGALRVRQAGDAHLEREGAAKAVDCFERAIALYPRAWSLRLRLARAHEAAGRRDLAIQAVSDHVAHVSADLADLGEEFCGLRVQHAEQELLRLGGFASSAARHLADAYRAVGRDEDAARSLRTGAMSLLEARRPASALDLCTDLIDLCPDDHRSRRVAARCHAAVGDVSQALGQLRRVASRLVRDGEWDEVREVYAEMMEIDPGSPDARVGHARALQQAGLDDEAAEGFRRAGLLFRGCGRAEDALPAFREAVERRPGDATLLAEHCELLITAGAEPQEAVSALGSLLELQSSRGEHDLAAVTLTRIVRLDPAFPDAAERMAEIASALCAAQGSRPAVQRPTSADASA